ncbi:MAG: hypothetical protein AAGU27_18335 [Dehalobacterium sp.]
MNHEYLLKPVIDIKDGDELRSFRLFYLFIIAFLFGLIPALILSVRNSFWVNKKLIVILVVSSIALLIVHYTYFGFYYYNHIVLQIGKISGTPQNGIISLLREYIK